MISLKAACIAGAFALGMPWAAAAATVLEAQGDFDFADVFDTLQLEFQDPSSEFSGVFMGDVFGVSIETNGPDAPTGSLSAGSLLSSSTLLAIDEDPADGMGGEEVLNKPFAFIFGDLSGSLADEFGPAARVLFTLSETGERVFEDESGFTIPASATLAPIPLPASLTLLVAGLGGLAALRRARG